MIRVFFYREENLIGWTDCTESEACKLDSAIGRVARALNIGGVSVVLKRHVDIIDAQAKEIVRLKQEAACASST